MSKNRILYITSTYFLDYDLSYFRHLNTLNVKITFLLDIPYAGRESTLFSYKGKLKSGIYAFKNNKKLFPEYFSKYLDFENSYFILRNNRKVIAVSNILLQFKIFMFIKKNKYNFIHFNNYHSLNFGWILLFRKKGIDLLTIHDPIAHSGDNSKKAKNRRKLCIRKASKILIHNQNQLDTFAAENNFKKSNIFVSKIGEYSVLKEFEPKNYTVIPDSLLFFGKINKYKGVENLIGAIKKLRKQNFKFKITIAGKGEIKQNIDDLNNDVKIINRYLSPEELNLKQRSI